MTETMRALVSGRGPEWVLADVPVPQPAPGQVLIRNRASATNNADLPMLAEADPSSGGSGEQFIAGFEYAGEVDALGADAGAWQVGDLVMGTFPSAFAEYVVADHRFVLPRPARLAPEVACALPTALLTEFGALRVAGFEAGQSVLVTGATTGIGLIGVQIAKAVGASRIIATTRGGAKKELLVGVGADVVMVTDEEDLTEAVLAATDGKGVDVVLDHVAGETFAQCLPATAEDGHVVNIGRLAGPASTIDLDALSYRHLTCMVCRSASRATGRRCRSSRDCGRTCCPLLSVGRSGQSSTPLSTSRTSRRPPTGSAPATRWARSC
ncbi:alcohol dehydrogenase [Knoellia sinensis KCTC 19936]|uniref:Alcohol dehydrogenase n=1 Tax=Knoellia sinensis KCTC 19936 TaxID=1385520 RepID=A0A0A0J407_9MICO|nr:zinc-binding dehydrogenase [Knoellia sinensis]KGN31439.1 alcohol dehydrogenase [Knoellia sinensis KCTC 19936]